MYRFVDLDIHYRYENEGTGTGKRIDVRGVRVCDDIREWDGWMGRIGLDWTGIEPLQREARSRRGRSSQLRAGILLATVSLLCKYSWHLGS